MNIPPEKPMAFPHQFHRRNPPSRLKPSTVKFVSKNLPFDSLKLNKLRNIEAVQPLQSISLEENSENDVPHMKLQLVVFSNYGNNMLFPNYLQQQLLPVMLRRCELQASLWVSEILKIPVGVTQEFTIHTESATVFSGRFILEDPEGLICRVHVNVHTQTQRVTRSVRPEDGVDLNLAVRLVVASLANILNNI